MKSPIREASARQRDDPRDAFLSTKAASLAALPMGASVGAASLRRQAQLLRRRPDLTILPMIRQPLSISASSESKTDDLPKGVSIPGWDHERQVPAPGLERAHLQ
jgi:hypothetical protein